MVYSSYTISNKLSLVLQKRIHLWKGPLGYLLRAKLLQLTLHVCDSFDAISILYLSRQGIMDCYPRRGDNCNVIESFFDVFL